MENRRAKQISKHIQEYFGFLTGKGFTFHPVEYMSRFNGNWAAQFDSVRCSIFLTSDRNHLVVELAPVGDVHVSKRITLEKILFQVSEGKIVVKPFRGNLAWGQKRQFERLSGLLSQYIDEIVRHSIKERPKTACSRIQIQ
jgi:hypothetical protein